MRLLDPRSMQQSNEEAFRIQGKFGGAPSAMDDGHGTISVLVEEHARFDTPGPEKALEAARSIHPHRGVSRLSSQEGNQDLASTKLDCPGSEPLGEAVRWSRLPLPRSC